MTINRFGIVLATMDGNPLQDMMLAPFTHFEDGKTIIRRRSDDNINLHMAVTISTDLDCLSKIKPVIYRLEHAPQMDFDSGKGLSIESRWYNPEFDRERRLGW